MTVVTNPACTESDEEIALSPYERRIDPNLSPEQLVELSTRLFEEDKAEDVTFVVETAGKEWRYRGHRRVLAAASPVFAQLVAIKADVIPVDYIHRKGFEQLLRYHYCEKPQLDTVANTRYTLDAAYKFLCPQLVERCARRLDELLSASLALDLLRDLRYMCARLPGVASAPPLPAMADDVSARLLAQCTRWCDSLAHNALLVIDDDADEALCHELIQELSYEDLALIVRRETLRVTNEMVLVQALWRWATVACMRTNRELTPINKRAALGGLAYCPRYLLLQGGELDEALELELLQPMERALVIARARKLSAPVPVGADQEAMLRHWARPRPSVPAALPVPLSARSTLPPEGGVMSRLCGRFSSKRPKPAPSFEPEFDDPYAPRKKGCCACFGEGLLRAFICLFD